MSPTTPLNEVIEEPTSSMDIENTGVEVKRSHPGSSILASPVISPENRHRVNGTVDDISASAPPKSYEEDSLMSEVAATPTEVPAPPPTKVKLSLKDFAERKRRERQEKEKAEREERERVKDEERAREAGQKEETESAQSSGRHESFAELPLEVKKEFLEDSTPLPLTDAVSVAAPIAASSTDAVVSPLIETTLSSPTSPIPVLSLEFSAANDLETRILQEHPRTDDDVILKASETRNKLISSLPSGPSVTPSSLIFPAVSSYLTPHSPEIEASLDGNAADDVGADNPEDGEIQDGEGGNKTGEDRTNHFTSSPYRAPSPPHLTPSTTLPPSLPAKPSPRIMASLQRQL
ncbi:hypothetical protein D9757_012950 [Collybiopsis confluens]|uniref:Uncharacterized protein n=1 Tax=Collybiopsis confluens TaxID=2823264 RepID=A0A8H5D5A3_9AGAR|nr:hypothetical protein D9757_012950 [Collybiopsis confluens]